VYRPEQIAFLNLIDGLLTEKKNYIESEEMYSKCIVYSLYLFGDPRGRGNYGNNFLLFPLWKISRQTCMLENSLINENFKEMFHSQEYIFRNSFDMNSNPLKDTMDLNQRKEFKEFLNKTNAGNERKKSQQMSIKSKMKDRDRVNLEDINFEDDSNIEENISAVYPKAKLSFKSFDLTKKKYFVFPSISDIKTSYSSYFNSENFITFLFRNLITFNVSGTLWDDDIINKIGLGAHKITNVSNLSTNGSVKTKKVKNEVFSHLMYDQLLDKLYFKKTMPKGVVLTWGNNMHNETSHNNYEKLSLPRMCTKMKDEEIKSVSCGWEHSIAINSDLQCFSWGNNESGQCGVGTTSPIIFNPSKIEGLSNVKSVSCGNDHSLALTLSGDVYSWGKADGGVLGYKDNEYEYSPKRIKSLKNIEDICCGSLHNIALTKDGVLYSWGCGEGGQLGHTEEFLLHEDSTGCISTPSVIQHLMHTKVRQISCGEAHSVALTYDGKVYGWGFNSSGQLGFGKSIT